MIEFCLSEVCDQTELIYDDRKQSGYLLGMEHKWRKGQRNFLDGRTVPFLVKMAPDITSLCTRDLCISLYGNS